MKSQIVEVIYISANPKNTGNIDTDEEYMEIKRALDKGRHRDRFKLSNPIFRTKLGDLADSLTNLNSDNCILHFSAHGNPIGNFILEQVDGTEKEIEPGRLSEYLGKYKQNLYGVVYSACYSDDLANTTNKTTDSFTIGFETPVSVSAAALFSYNFYLELLKSLDPKDAFDKAFGFSKLQTDTNHTATFYNGKREGFLNREYLLVELNERKEILEKIIDLEAKSGSEISWFKTDLHKILEDKGFAGVPEVLQKIEESQFSYNKSSLANFRQQAAEQLTQLAPSNYITGLKIFIDTLR